MSESDSIAHEAPIKPDKLHPDFPLFLHATKRGAKKSRGKRHYFAPWNDSDSVLKKYI